MLKNYLLTAWRNFLKNKTFSFINTAGLALGMTCSLLIMLWIQDEREMDQFHANNENLYSVYERQYYDGKVEAFHGTPGVLAEEMKKVLPEVIYAANQTWDDKVAFSAGDKIIKQEGITAGADFFKIFSFPLLKGKAEKAAADHPEQAEKFSDQAIQQAGDSADKVTGDKHSEQVDSAQQKADDAIGS